MDSPIVRWMIRYSFNVAIRRIQYHETQVLWHQQRAEMYREKLREVREKLGLPPAAEKGPRYE